MNLILPNNLNKKPISPYRQLTEDYLKKLQMLVEKYIDDLFLLNNQLTKSSALQQESV